MIFKIIKRNTHEIFFFFIAILKKKRRLYDSGPSLCIFVGMRIAEWRYCYELMATKHHTVKGQTGKGNLRSPPWFFTFFSSFITTERV